MIKQRALLFTGLALTAFAAYAASVPNIFSAGDPARAADVNANFTALANAVTTLEAKIAALEAANSPLTAAEMAGTWKYLALATKVVSGAASRQFGLRSDITDGDMTLTVTSPAGGTLALSSNITASGLKGEATQCFSLGGVFGGWKPSARAHNPKRVAVHGGWRSLPGSGYDLIR